MDIELRHLRIVCAIAEAGSVTKAAAALGLAQPALATQLKRIERSLGGVLFLRDRLGVRPTALGDLVLARARVLLPALRGLQDEATEMVGAARATRYRVGVTNGPFAGGLVQRLTTAYPRHQVSAHSTFSMNEIIEKVATDELDFALIGACAGSVPCRPDALVWQPVSLDPVWVLLPAGHPLAGRAEVALGELADERWISAPGDGCFHECFAAACARAGFSPRPILERDPSGAFDMVANGSGLVLCQGIVRDIPGAVAMPIADSPLRWRHLLGWDRGSVAARSAPEVYRLAVQAYLEVVGQRHRYANWLAGHPGFGVQPAAPNRLSGAASPQGLSRWRACS
ncbi:LysR substrate-binding domain-containing protein [Micromonosporaceae bacterium Da 78-11]